MTLHLPFFFFFFFNDTATTEIYPLSLHDALPIYHPPARVLRSLPNTPSGGPNITGVLPGGGRGTDRKSTRLNSSHQIISYAVFCLKKKKNIANNEHSASSLPLIPYSAR